MLIILLLTELLGSASLVAAESKDYEWEVYGATRYNVSVIVENPQLDSDFSVTVRLSLVSKDWSLRFTRTKWMQVLISSAGKPLNLDSGKYEESVFLNETGDSWQRTFSFHIASSEYDVGRGQSIHISIVYKIAIEEISVEPKTYYHATDSINDPLALTLSVPLLSIFEIIVIIVAVVVVLWLSYPKVGRWMKRKKEEGERKAKEEEKRRMLVDNYECPFCGTMYDRKFDRCPRCGAHKKAEP